MKKRWNTVELRNDRVLTLAGELNLNPISAGILLSRGIHDVAAGQKFLNPELRDLNDYTLLKDADLAADRLATALAKGEKITIYGDYDVDGLSSTALMVSFFNELNYPVDYYIPHRITEGYALNRPAIDTIKGWGTKLLVTVDCGVSNKDEIDYATSCGMDVIVTDHHTLPPELPKAVAVLNPKRSDCPFPFKDLAGVGVALFLVIALRARLREDGYFKHIKEPNLKKFLDLVALGTVADITPLVEDNRILVSCGLPVLNANGRPGLAALRDISGANRTDLSAKDISFKLAPRINALGRMDDPRPAIALLTTGNYDQALEIAKLMDQKNLERQKVEDQTMTQALAMLSDLEANDDRTLVLCSEGWHKGVAGIVAARIAARFFKPTIMLIQENGLAKGSGRSIPTFNLMEGLQSCEELLEAYGGHKFAAGMSVAVKNLPAFKQAFEQVARERLRAEDLIPVVNVDAVVELAQVTDQLVWELEKLEPFDPANPEPVLASFKCEVMDKFCVGPSGKHLRLVLRQGNVLVDSVGFGLGGLLSSLGPRVDVAYTPEINIWQGQAGLRLRLKDVRSAG
ncbi:MAG: single-stranded-DNA-specific exonuclease RecJ [Deltaproteobacteria bacterium]|nr:single-stranded-DNA-specific exonuclease RecJ [Deltaproteobacteria bacterium]